MSSTGSNGLQVLAEKAAWKFCSEHKIDLVTICPNFGEQVWEVYRFVIIDI